MSRGVNVAAESVPVPGTDPVYSSAFDLQTVGEAIVRATNSTDQSLMVTIQTAMGDDRQFSAPNASGDGFVGVSAVGGIPVTGFVSPASPSREIVAGEVAYIRVAGAWAYARLQAVAAAVPAEGGTLDLRWDIKHRRD